MPNVPISSQISVTVNVSTPGLSAQAFGTPLFLGLSARLPPTDRFRLYPNLDGVAVDFQTTDPEYIAAARWFAQALNGNVPQFAIGRRWTSAVAGALYGAPLTAAQQAIALFQAVTNGGFDITINGALKQITALNLASATTLNLVAAALQTALNTALAGTTCVFTGSRFVVTSPTTGTASSVSFAAVPTGSGTPVDIGALLGFKSTSGGYASTGAAAEATADVSLANVLDKSSQWYGFTLSSDSTDADRKLAITWAIAKNKVYLHTEQSATVLASGDTTSVTYWATTQTPASATSQNVGACFALYSSTDAYAALGAWATLARIDFTQSDAMTILEGAQISGVTPESLSETQFNYLLTYKCNVYCYFGSYPKISDGHTSSGRWLDEVMGLAWLQSTVQTDIFLFLRSTKSKIPQTDAGQSRMLSVVGAGCQKAVNNGLLAPGVWTQLPVVADSGDIVNTGDYLRKGFRVLTNTMANQDAATRNTRKAPRIFAAVKGAGAIQGADVLINFDR